MRSHLTKLLLIFIALLIGAGEGWCEGYLVPIKRRSVGADGTEVVEGEGRLPGGGRIRVRRIYRPDTEEEKARREAWFREVDERHRKETAEWEEEIRKKRAPKERAEAARRKRAARAAARRLFLNNEKQQLAQVRKSRKAGRISEAVTMLEQMTKKGFPNAAYILGKMYLDGDGVKPDKSKAFKYFYDSAKNGSGTGAFALARAYMHGDGVKQNYQRAASWLKVSNLPAARYLLGSMYLDGFGIDRDFGKAWKTLKECADCRATASLGEICYLGLGMPRRALEARRWFSAAARVGNAKALFYLARIYAAGDGVEKNDQKHDEYLERYKQAKEKLGKLNEFDRKLAFSGYGDMESRMQRLKKESTEQNNQRRRIASAPVLEEAESKKQLNDCESAQGKMDRSKKIKVRGKSRDEVYKEVEQLVTTFYPKAKVKRKEKALHFYYKTRPGQDRSGKIVQIPKLDGIIGDITLVSGPYPGKEYLPARTNGTLYVTLLMAPYSSEEDNHLLTHLKFPPNAPLEFVSRFQKAIRMYSGN